MDDLVARFVSNGWIYRSKHCLSEEEMYVKAELLILGVLKVLGHHDPFRTLKTDTKISPPHHCSFFHFFIDRMYRIKSEYINYPSTQDKLKNVMGRYKENFLPGCGRSVDVVHVVWSKCPAGDYNLCKGKEGYPSVAFEVITGYDRQILGVSSMHFGTRNDQRIVRTDETLSVIKNGWYRNVGLVYYHEFGREQFDYGVYLICNDHR